MNNGVIHPIGGAGDRLTPWADYTCGESNTFVDAPASRFAVSSATGVAAQWHTLINLGSQWAAPGECTCANMEDTCDDASKCTPLTTQELAAYTAAIRARQGVLTLDLQLLRNGSMNAQQVAFIHEAWSNARR